MRAASASIAWPRSRIGRGESRENSERRERRERRERGGRQGLPVPVPVPLVQMHPHNQGTQLTMTQRAPLKLTSSCENTRLLGTKRKR